MRFRTSVLLLVGLSLLLNGCVLSRGRVGNPIQEEYLSQIEKGISKKELVLLLHPIKVEKTTDGKRS